MKKAAKLDEARAFGVQEKIVLCHRNEFALAVAVCGVARNTPLVVHNLDATVIDNTTGVKPRVF